MLTEDGSKVDNHDDMCKMANDYFCEIFAGHIITVAEHDSIDPKVITIEHTISLMACSKISLQLSNRCILIKNQVQMA